MYIRVLSLRKHKLVTFINAYSEEFGNTQFMVDNDTYNNIKCGDLLKIEYVNTINNKGNSIKKITKILQIIPCHNFDSGKGMNGIVVNQKEKDYIDARNCGKQLNVLKFKHELLNNIKQILDSSNYFDASGLTNVVEYYAGGSNIVEATIEGRVEGELKYLRSTIENQLKQITALTLKSTYAIEKVFRNMGEDNTHINEFLMLEIVSLNSNVENMNNFVFQIDKLAKEICEKHSIPFPEKSINIIDYNEIAHSSIEYDRIRKDFVNTLVTNFPCDSPYIKKNEISGIRTETRWYINGHWISHYYDDENNINNIKEMLITQQSAKNVCINPMDYFEWGLPNTISFGLSIDRWLQMLLDFENINSIANPIELNYIKKKVRG